MISIYRIKPEIKDTQTGSILFKLIKRSFLVCFLVLLLLPSQAKAVADPLQFSNNKHGIHIISPTNEEIEPAEKLVNSNGGDWGYVTVLIESKDRNKDKWQTFFNELRRRHLIPIVRLATYSQGDSWRVPEESDAEAWANFLDELNWPIKNRYVVIYNEPNQGKEWGGKIDPRAYARVLDKTITALKSKSSDFFVLNAGFDAAAPALPPRYQDMVRFVKEMNTEVPGIFDRLDGWSSHSYPNPGFVGQPFSMGRTTVHGWMWELNLLRELGISKELPVFITETGWKHAEGLTYDRSLPRAEAVAGYYRHAYLYAWSGKKVVAVTPFLLTYQEEPFDHFSFKKPTSHIQNQKILGVTDSDYYPQYQELVNIPKEKGYPPQETKANFVSGSIPPLILTEDEHTLVFMFKNTGQSIWNDYEMVELKALDLPQGLEVASAKIPSDQKIEPGHEATFELNIKAIKPGRYNLSLQLFTGNKPFDQEPVKLTTDAKAPVILELQTTLSLTDDSSGEYVLLITSNDINRMLKIKFDKSGNSDKIYAKYLVPDNTYKMTLYKPFYKPQTLEVKLVQDRNSIVFERFQPDLLSSIFKPATLWQMLPISQ